MQTLIENVLQWGNERNIIGPSGKGTTKGQAAKMMEEAQETIDAVWSDHGTEECKAEIKDGIGDTAVTLILLAEMHGWTFEECLQTAYDEIKGRTGQMVSGTFIKDIPPSDDDLGELDPSAACKLGDETCESCQ